MGAVLPFCKRGEGIETRDAEPLAARDGPHGGGDEHERRGVDVEGGIGAAAVAHPCGLGEGAVVVAVVPAQVNLKSVCSEDGSKATLSGVVGQLAPEEITGLIWQRLDSKLEETLLYTWG